MLLLVLRVRTTPHVNCTSCRGRAHFLWVVTVARAGDRPLIPWDPRVHPRALSESRFSRGRTEELDNFL